MTVTTATILSDGETLDSRWALMSLDIERELNRIPSAELCLVDGDATQGKFEISNLPFFEPGRALEIKLRYEGLTEDTTVFKGIVVRHGVESRGAASLLRIVAKDAAISMTRVRRSADFADQSEDQIFQTILQEHPVTIGQIASGLPQQQVMVQYDATDWDFLLSRADVLGLVVALDDGEISVVKPEANDKPQQVFQWGLDEIFELEMEADGGRQILELSSAGWDVSQQTLTDPAKATEPAVQQGNLSGAKLAEALNFSAEALVHPVPLQVAELQAWSDARLVRSRLAMVRGRLAVPGRSDPQLLAAIEIKGVGDRFNGSNIITAVRHRVDTAGWRTDVQFGLPPDGFCRHADIQPPPASGLLPAIEGLQVGVVEAFEADPDQQFRVRVRLPRLGDTSKGVWARLAQADAGLQRGFCFRPEPDDEVVVGFFNGDPRQAVILGALHSTKNTPPAPYDQPDEKNVNKALVTRAGTTIGFLDDEKPSVFIETAGKNKIILDDNNQLVSLTDQHGNSITMDKSGISIKSAKDVTIEASGNVAIKGAKVDVQ